MHRVIFELSLFFPHRLIQITSKMRESTQIADFFICTHHLEPKRTSYWNHRTEKVGPPGWGWAWGGGVEVEVSICIHHLEPKRTSYWNHRTEKVGPLDRGLFGGGWDGGGGGGCPFAYTIWNPRGYLTGIIVKGRSVSFPGGGLGLLGGGFPFAYTIWNPRGLLTGIIVRRR